MLRPRRPIRQRFPQGAASAWVLHAMVPLLLLTAFLLTALAALVQANRRQLFARALLLHLRYSLQRDVQVQGVDFSERGRVTVTGLRVREPDGSTLAAARAITVRFDPRRMYRLPLRPAGAITSVVVDRPYFVLSRGATGAWNIADLLQQRKPPSKDTFRGALRVHDGEFVFHDGRGLLTPGQPIDEHLTNIEVRLTRAGGDYTPFSLSAVSALRHLKRIAIAGSIDLVNLRAQGSLAHDELNLALLHKYLPPRFQQALVVESGTATGRWHAQLALEQDGRRELRLVGTADLRDVRGTLRAGRTYPYALDRGQVSYCDGLIELRGLEGRLAEVPFRADGNLSGAHFSTIALDVQTTDAPTARLLRLVPGMDKLPATWGGTTTGHAAMTGTVRAPVIAGDFRGGSVALNGAAFTRIAGAFHFAGNAVTLNGLSADAFGGHVTGDAWAAVGGKTPAFLFRGDAHGVETHAVLDQFAPADKPGPRPPVTLRDLRGTVDGPVALEIAGKDDMTLIAHPKGTLAVGAYTRGPMDAALKIHARGKKAAVEIERLTANLPEGRFDLRGTVAENTALDLTLRGDSVQLHTLAALAKYNDVDGTGYLTGHVTGTADAPVFAGNFHARKGHVAQRAFDDLTGRVRATLGPAPVLALENVRLSAGGNRVELSTTLTGTAGKPDVWGVASTVTLPRTSLRALAATAGVDSPLDGMVEGRLEVTDLTDTPHGKGRVIIQRPVLHLGDASLEFDRAEINFTISGKQLDLMPAELIYQGDRITITGQASFDPNTPPARQLSLRVSARALNLDKLISPHAATGKDLFVDGALCLPFDLVGTLGLEASITGQLVPGKGMTPEQTLPPSLRIAGSIDTGPQLEIAGIPYQGGRIELGYQGDTETLTISKFALARAGAPRRYTLSLVKPGSINLQTQEVEAHFALLDGAVAGKTVVPGASLAQLRRDAVTASRACVNGPCPLDGLETLPVIDGRGDIRLDVEGTVQHPSIHTALALRNLTVAGNTLPDIDGALTYDTELDRHRISFESTALPWGPDRGATAHLEGSIALPVKDAAGRDLIPGEINNLSFSAQNVDFSEVGQWFNIPPLREIQGKATVDASVTNTTSHPYVSASLDIAGDGTNAPSIHGVPFSSLSVTAALDDDGIWIGQWVKRPRSGNGKRENDPLYCNGKMIVPGSGATVAFKDADKGHMEPLELYGHIPFRWTGPLQAEIPPDESLLLYAHLPRQGFDVVRAYLPAPDPKAGPGWTLPQNAGALEAALQVSGTRQRLTVTGGFVRARLPEIKLAQTDKDLPDLLRDLNVDLAFREDAKAKQSVLQVNDLSFIYDRTDRKDARPLPWYKQIIQKIVGTDQLNPVAFAPGAVVVRGDSKLGAVRVDMKELVRADGSLIPAAEIPNKLEYHLYGKLLHTSLRLRSLHGVVTSYLALENNYEDGSKRPLLRGVAYLEHGRLIITPEAQDTAPPPALVPMDVKVALQMGDDNACFIKIANENLANLGSFWLPFMGTREPDGEQKTMAIVYEPGDLGFLNPDQDTLAKNTLRLPKKPPMDTTWSGYRYDDGTLYQQFTDIPLGDAGTYGALYTDRTLAANTNEPLPLVLKMNFALLPNKGKIWSIGGQQTVTTGTGSLLFPLFPAFAHNTPRMPTTAETTGTLNDGYHITGKLEGDLLLKDTSADNRERDTAQALISKLTYTMSSAPSGMPPIENEEIIRRLYGFSEINTVISDKSSDILGRAFEIGRISLSGGFFNRWLAPYMGLSSLDFSLDPARKPQVSATSKEFFDSRWGALRLSTTYGSQATTAAQPNDWSLSTDYRLPDYPLPYGMSLRDFTISTKTDTQHNRSLNLQWVHQF